MALWTVIIAAFCWFYTFQPARSVISGSVALGKHSQSASRSSTDLNILLLGGTEREREEEREREIERESGMNECLKSLKYTRFIYLLYYLWNALKFERLILTTGLLFFPQFTYILSDIFIGFTFATFLKLFHRHDFCIVHYIYKQNIETRQS